MKKWVAWVTLVAFLVSIPVLGGGQTTEQEQQAAPAPQEEGAGSEGGPLAGQGTEEASEGLAGEAPDPGDATGEAEDSPPDSGEEE